MPLHIYRPATQANDDDDFQSLAWLCDDDWELSPQVYALQKWLNEHGKSLPPAEYVANIDFRWRRDASSRGPVLEPAAMRIMADIGMSLYFSEYAGFADEVTG